MMDFQSAMDAFTEAWAVAKGAPLNATTQSLALALTRGSRSPPAAPSATGRSSEGSAERGSPTPRISTPLDAAASPPSVKEESDSTKPSTVKTLPVHCIVESICSLDDRAQQNILRRRPLMDIDDRYVIIPSSTLFHNLVPTALLKLGYTQENAAAAKGLIMIKNWKALSFDQISEEPLVTVGDILGELTTIATLNIQVFRGKPPAITEIKDKLLKFFLLQNHGLLMQQGCPLGEQILNQLCRNSGQCASNLEISEENRLKFDQWWSAHFSPPSSAGRSQFVPTYPNQYPVPTTTHPTMDRSIPETGHPAMQNVQSSFPPQKTRMRTSFDPELELPKLQRWFTENQHPSRQQIQQYVKELNSLESRRGRKPLDVNNVVYWFKNARAAQKRAEVRNVTPLPCHLGMNGYNSHSPTNGSFLLSDVYPDRLGDRLKQVPGRRLQNSHTPDSFSNAGSDLDDDDMGEDRPQSPSLPLSLTTRKEDSRNGSPRSSTPNPSESQVKQEPKDFSHEHINNNKIHLSEMEEDDGEEDKKSHFEGMASTSPPSMSTSQGLCLSPEESRMNIRNTESSLEHLPGFPFLNHVMYMPYPLGMPHPPNSPPGCSAEERRKRNRTFIDPVSEVPRLEHWFSQNTHPSHNQIQKYTEELNCMAYRQKFPKLETKNVQFWFKNRRAKCKRLKLSMYDNPTTMQYHNTERD